MRVVVTGATGNAGTGVVRAPARDPAVSRGTGTARRLPGHGVEGVRWEVADVDPGGSDLDTLFRGADAVVHLAWKFHPTHDPVETWRTNVLGSVRVFEACARNGVHTWVHASSVGAYSPGPEDGRPVDESWPTHGWPGEARTREKPYLERYLDGFQPANPQMRVVRMRPGFLSLPKHAPAVGRYPARSPSATDCLPAALIFLADDLLLRKPLRPEHLTSRLLGRCEITCAGITTVCSALVLHRSVPRGCHGACWRPVAGPATAGYGQ
ncbi:NAD-dependent epimerase/dehydratase family protein [Streptomyces sp. NPDC059456]|uniref:NAD-dependent epimerase/dehydratase family protein n=1 Tax=Streptomyces sp. NPDC059456 TaxID=3346838 RepID=UPI0036C138C0